MGKSGNEPRPKREKRSVMRVILIYALVAGLWVIFTDRLLEMAGMTAQQMARLSTAKGILFVLVTSSLLYLLVHRHTVATRAAESARRLTLDSLPDGVIVLNSRLETLEINQAAFRLMGLKHSQALVDANFFSEWLKTARVFGPDGGTAEHQLSTPEFAFARAMRGEVIQGIERTVIADNGQPIYLSISAAPVRYRGEHVEAVVIVLHDVSKLKELQRVRDEFLSNAAHELKTPITVIKSNVQLARKINDKLAPEKRERMQDTIDQQCNVLAHLVEELIETSLARAGMLTLQVQDVELCSLVSRTVQEFSRQLGRTRIQLTCPDEIRLRADPDRLTRVLRNLLENATKFSAAGERIEVETSTRELDGRPHAVVSVQDHGRGISESEKPRIFEKYFRGHLTSPHEYGGMGIGLYLSREILRAHGGEMGFSSREGEGSTFYFALPLAERRAEAS